MTPLKRGTRFRMTRRVRQVLHNGAWDTDPVWVVTRVVRYGDDDANATVYYRHDDGTSGPGQWRTTPAALDADHGIEVLP